MQLLVFAHTPPPVHGQSMMVRTLLDGLPGAAPELKIYHVNPQLSRNSAEIGRWQLRKLALLIRACLQAIALRLRHGRMSFYYIPAPGRRAPLYRDWLALALCRPFFQHLVLHWHGVGLGNWITRHAHPIERGLTHLILGRAALSLVLAPELVKDAHLFSPRKIVIVPNGIPDPGPRARRDRSPNQPTQILFLGLCSPEKGIFDLLTAVGVANRRVPGGFRLTVAGGFGNQGDEAAFFSQAASLGSDLVRHIGFADDTQKHVLLDGADVVCLPTSHPYEAQPLVLIEALAHDVPIITTRWRAIPGMLPEAGVWFVDRGRPDQIANALVDCRNEPPPPGKRRAHYLAHFTRERHLRELATALASLTEVAPPASS